MGFFLFVVWPLLFYLYLHCFVHAAIYHGIVLAPTSGPHIIPISLESAELFIMAFIRVPSIFFLGFELEPTYFKQFVIENFYYLAVICNSLNLSIKIW